MAVQQIAKATTSVAEAMKNTPLAIALLLVNVGFLGFAGYVLNIIGENAQTRDKTQLELVSNLVKDLRELALHCK